jgi:hypothetical protein
LLKEWGDHLPNGHITISDNGWTDNKLFLEWLERCFEPETRKLHGDSEYRMLIVDGHASHISTDAIRFCIKHKIVLFNLPAHSTHLLQPLDVGIFASLAIAYKQRLLSRIRPGALSYHIDKVDFLQMYQQARNLGAQPLLHRQVAYHRISGI